MGRRRRSESPSSSMDSSAHPLSSPAGCRPPAPTSRDLTTDLQLGLSSSAASSLPHHHNPLPDSTTPSTSSRSAVTAAERRAGRERSLRQPPATKATMFVKVYMEGIPIGRKLDLLLLHGYHALVAHLRRMFHTPIAYPDDMDRVVVLPVAKKASHVLTYEDHDGDWMLVGDVPWQLFVSSVKRLRIARADNC